MVPDSDWDTGKLEAVPAKIKVGQESQSLKLQAMKSHKCNFVLLKLSRWQQLQKFQLWIFNCGNRYFTQ